jgi:hypothetical protein
MTKHISRRVRKLIWKLFTQNFASLGSIHRANAILKAIPCAQIPEISTPRHHFSVFYPTEIIL